MKPYEEEKEHAMNWAFAMTLRQKENPAKPNTVLGSQFNKPLLESFLVLVLVAAKRLMLNY